MQTLFSHLGKLTMLLMAFAAGLSWWLAPNPHATPAAASQADAWTLPAVSRAEPDKAVAAIAAANLWGGAQGDAAITPLNPPEWRFSGITSDGREKLVMITIEGTPMQTLKAGEQLPGGAKILKINDDHLCLSINGKKRNLSLFQ
ncbi:MAG TPA: type II secretion system protein N [Gallionella sp.]|nr:type II secretion system protein N [Gallionella sp.]